MTRPADFRDAMVAGRSFAGRLIILKLRDGADACFRLGVVAGIRTFPRAVDRMRCKRLLREAFRLNQHRLATRSDVVLIARRGMESAGLAVVEKDLLVLARRAGVLREGESLG